MRAVLCILIFVFTCFASNKKLLAQTDSLPRYKHQLKIAPLRLLIGLSQGLQASYQYNAGKRYATEVMAMYIFNPMRPDSSDARKDLYGYGFGITQKKYIDFWQRTRGYIALDFNLLDYHFRTRLGYKEANSTTQSYFHDYLDTVLVRRRLYLLNLRAGEEWRIKRLVIELNVGFGLRYRQVRHSEKLHPEDRMASPRHPNIGAALHGDGSYLTLNFPASFKIGFCF